MPGQQHIDWNLSEDFHGQSGAKHDPIAFDAGRQIERMMGDDNFDVCRRQGRKSGAQFCELLAIDPAVLARKRASRVDAGDGDLIVDIERLEVLGDETPETVELAKQSREDVVQRHVVISWNNDFRERDRIQECARFQELCCARPLGQIARDRDQIRFGHADEVEQRGDDSRINRPKMQIGKMNQRPHQPIELGRTMTRRSRGRDR